MHCMRTVSKKNTHSLTKTKQRTSNNHTFNFSSKHTYYGLSMSVVGNAEPPKDRNLMSCEYVVVEWEDMGKTAIFRCI